MWRIFHDSKIVHKKITFKVSHSDDRWNLLFGVLYKALAVKWNFVFAHWISQCDHFFVLTLSSGTLLLQSFWSIQLNVPGAHALPYYIIKMNQYIWFNHIHSTIWFIYFPNRIFYYNCDFKNSRTELNYLRDFSEYNLVVSHASFIFSTWKVSKSFDSVHLLRCARVFIRIFILS